MFGKSPREPQSEPPEKLELKDVKLSPNISPPFDRQQDTLLQTDSNEISNAENSELVNTVEKISRIVSPYFLVIVGLSLSDNNFFIGTILILIGILSLLKISTKDVAKFLEWLKNFFGFSS
jgi:hypothetical protein